MRCEETVDSLLDFVDDALDPERRQAVTNHLAACVLCERFFSSYRATMTLCRHIDWGGAPAGAIDSLLAGVRQAWLRCHAGQ